MISKRTTQLFKPSSVATSPQKVPWVHPTLCFSTILMTHGSVPPFRAIWMTHCLSASQHVMDVDIVVQVFRLTSIIAQTFARSSFLRCFREHRCQSTQLSCKASCGFATAQCHFSQSQPRVVPAFR